MLGNIFQKKKYPEAFEAQKIVVASDSMNYNAHFILSWYALFAGKPKVVIRSAQKVLELASSRQSVETNLALGYLLDGQWEKAKTIYLKGKEFPNGRPCNPIFLKDIADLEAAGITHPDFERVRELLGE